LIKERHLIGTRTRDLPACSVVPQPTTLPPAPTLTLLPYNIPKCLPLHLMIIKYSVIYKECCVTNKRNIICISASCWNNWLILWFKILSVSAAFVHLRRLYDSSLFSRYFLFFVRNMYRPHTAIARYTNYTRCKLFHCTLFILGNIPDDDIVRPKHTVNK
jgi:hypothetical protein